MALAATMAALLANAGSPALAAGKKRPEPPAGSGPVTIIPTPPGDTPAQSAARPAVTAAMDAMWMKADPPSPIEGPGGEAWTEETDPPMEWLIPYYDAVTGGLISPAPAAAPDTPAQDYFQLDVEGFLGRTRHADFAEAKRAFYGNLDFDTKRQKHEEPYYYMVPWKLLFHPPIKRLSLPRARYHSGMQAWDPAAHESPYFEPRLQWDIDFKTGTEMTYGNELELRPNQSSYRERLRMLREAKKYFFGTVMFYTCDTTGNEFLEELIRRKKEGIDVRMIVEGLYAYTINRKCIDRMIKGGVDVIRVDDFWKPTSFISVLHNKFWIRDGEEAVIGGQNFHDFANTSDGFHLTRDTDVWVKRGPSVTDLEYEYLRLWKRYAKKRKNQPAEPYLSAVAARIEKERQTRVRGRLSYSYWLSDPAKRMNGICRVMVQDRMASRQAIAPLLIDYINAAKSHVFMTTPSVKFNKKDKVKKPKLEDELFFAYQRAANERGVKLDLVSNGLAGGMGDMQNFFEKFLDSDSLKNKKLIKKLIRSLGVSMSENGAEKDRDHMLKVLEKVPGSRAWGYFQFLHAKTQLFDRTLAGVTSFNWDGHSSRTNHESGIFCLDRKLVNQLEEQMVMDLINSVPIVSRNGF
ncbi:MAG: hypothetical protein IT285_03060 [Bdellovibrionales bacterium]|nr:hypothetical protein [Bdellovibrionales bacterium]